MRRRSMRSFLTLLGWLPVAALLACSGGSESASSDVASSGGGAGESFPSGLVIEHLKEGSGANPTAASTVTVHYHGTLEDGTVFDSSVQRGQPATFPLSRVIPCWTEGVQKIKVGGKARLTCPAEIAYGTRGSPPVIPPNATLIFEVELFEIQ